MTNESCEKIRDLIPEALTGGAASAASSADLERHLAGCADCRREVEEARATIALVREAASPAGAPAAEPPSFDAVLARVRDGAVARPTARSRLPALAVRAAAIALAVAAGALADRLWLASGTGRDAADGSRPGQLQEAEDQQDARERVRRVIAARPHGLASSLAVIEALERERR